MFSRLLLLVCCFGGTAATQVPPQAYFPLVPGYRWVYRLPNGRTFEEKVVGPRTFGGYRCMLLTRVLDGEVTRLYYRWDEEGLKLVGREMAGTRRVFRPPILLLRVPFETGARWEHRAHGEVVRTTTMKANLVATKGEDRRPAVMITVRFYVDGEIVTCREIFVAGIGRIVREFLRDGSVQRVRLVRFVSTRQARLRAESPASTDPKALTRQALQCLRGKGQDRNAPRAVALLRRAALQGYAPAQYYLATCYVNGEGVKPDLIVAYVWCALASEQGHKGAARYLRDLAEWLGPKGTARARALLEKVRLRLAPRADA